MTRTEELMAKVEAGEMTMQEAIEAAAQKAPKRPTIANRVEWISGLSNLAELEKAIRIAYAKKSKAKGNEVTVAKYEEEIRAGQARKNELLAEINQAEDRVSKAIELGMDPSKLLQDVLADMEDEVAASIADLAAAKNVSKKALKEIMAEQATGIHPDIAARLGDLGQDFLDRYEERKGNGDQRVISLNKKYWTRDQLEEMQAVEPTQEPEAAPKKKKGKGKKAQAEGGSNEVAE